MNNEKLRVPKLRFKEFGKKLEEKKFEEIFSFSTGKNIKQNEASSEFKIPCVRYGELYHMYGEVISEIVNRTNLNKSELIFSQGDEILLPSAGEDPLDIGSASALTVANVAIGRTINILRPLSDNIYSQKYVAYYINEKLKKKISTLAKGSSISNVYNSDLKKLNINLPSLDEQEKIASFLSSINKKINQLSKKDELLQNYKKAIMQKIFSQKLRFKKADGSDYPKWEEKKIGNVLKIESGKDYKHLNEGNIPVYGTGGFMLNVDAYLYDGESVCIGRKGTINNPIFLEGKFWTVDTLFYTSSFKSILPKYFYYLSLEINWLMYNEGTTLPSLSKKTIESIKINLPSLEEQTKIANFISSIDTKISQNKKALEETQKFKKALLQKMFV